VGVEGGVQIGMGLRMETGTTGAVPFCQTEAGTTGPRACQKAAIGEPGGGPTQFKGSRGHSGDAQLQENGRLQRPTMKRVDLAPAERL
jgi:hypothetical protein